MEVPRNKRIREARARFVETCSRNEFMRGLYAINVFDHLMVPAYANRPYHNFDHILSLLDEQKLFGYDSDMVETAIWFHDVYMNYEDDAEAVKQSAMKALTLIAIHGRSNRSKFIDIVWATAHKGDNYRYEEEKVISSLDLITLGSPYEEYTKYCQKVKAEVLPNISDDIGIQDIKWSEGRLLFLSKMLDREFIYTWEPIRSIYEKQARLNMQTELDMFDK